MVASNRLFRAALALVALLTASQAHALDFCVGTIPELRQALNDAEIDGQPSVVRMRAGVYTMNAAVEYDTRPSEFFVSPGSLSLRGGYNLDCSAETGKTELISTTDAVMFLASGLGSIDVLGISFRGMKLGMSDFFDTSDQCSAPNGLRFAAERINLVSGYLSIDSVCHDVRIGNSLFRDGIQFSNPIDLVTTSLYVYTRGREDSSVRPDTRLVNLTIANGTLALGRSRPGQSAFIYNSIFVNDGEEILNDHALRIFNSRYDNLDNGGGGSLVLGSANNTFANPSLNSAGVPLAGSPMIDAGTSSTPGGLSAEDVYREDRVKGARVDMGAAESPFDLTGIYTVTNINSAGVGSLARAISDANTDPADNTIRFNIPGSCPQRISVPATLSVSDQLFINGYSQPQSLTNSFGNDDRNPGWNGRPCVILDGMDAGVTGISTASGLGSESLDVRGLAFERFATGISLTNGSGNRVRGNQFGGQVGSTGVVLRAGATAIRIENSNNTVGGAGGNADDNLIGASLNTGVLLTAAANQNVISGNRIGVDKNATAALANGTGIRISGAENEIRNNLIARNSGSGVVIRDATALENLVQDNQFHNAGSIGNGGSGVELSLSARDTDILGNRFVDNVSAGVRVASSALDHNRISGNTFRGNGLGIDLGTAGVSPNNPDNTLCTGGGCAANNGQNFPQFSSAVQTVSATPTTTLISGFLRTVVSTLPYRVEYYASSSCNVSGHGEGTRLIGSRVITVSNATGSACLGAPSECTVDASLSVSGSVQPGEFITAITIANNGNTSEFSGCVQVTTPTVVVSIFRNGFE